jgi:hypothetical protein
MNINAWMAVTEARNRFRLLTEELSRDLPELREAQQKLVDQRSGPAYPVETAVVYNAALDDLEPAAEIRLILVADNPGRREQAAENRRYLVGPSGKLAEKFFRERPELGIDFRKNVIILNKTPIHTPRTTELRDLCRLGGPRITEAVKDSQARMAALIAEFHRALAVPVWIIGYSEMKSGRVFEPFTAALKAHYGPENPLREGILLYRHFSMNQFTIDLRRQWRPGENVEAALERIGEGYRKRMLGF